MREGRPIGWLHIRRQLNGWPKPALIGLVKLLRTEGWDLYPRFRERVLSLRDDADKIGWGYGDSLLEQVDLLEAKLTGE